MDFSTPESKQFFENLQRDWESLGGCSQTFRESGSFSISSLTAFPSAHHRSRFREVQPDDSGCFGVHGKESGTGISGNSFRESFRAHRLLPDTVIPMPPSILNVGMGTFMNLVLKKDRDWWSGADLPNRPPTSGI